MNSPQIVASPTIQRQDSSRMWKGAETKTRSLRGGCRIHFLSTSFLVFLGTILTTITLGTNLFLALSLPTASSPSWLTTTDSTGAMIVNTLNSTSIDDTDHDMLHVVTSRFMQLQPNLTALGEARLRLFETFCLPSMSMQEVTNFVWFVMTDPDLDPQLLNQMRDLLAPYPHFFLVLMNSKLVTSGDLDDMIQRKLFLTGDIDHLRSIMLDPSRPLLLETRLDADDALNARTLFEIQRAARRLPYDEKGWQVICNNLHYEWRNDEILNTSIPGIETSGSLRLVMEAICVTPGYTLVRHRPQGSIDFPAWPKLGHHLVNREWPKCLGRKNITTNCWVRLPKYPAALRSRTTTSAGMSRIESTPLDRSYDNQTKILWSYVMRDFGIVPEKAKSTSEYLKSHLQEIVEENLRGQCTFGHSCKESSREKLESLLGRTTNTTKASSAT